MKQIKKVLFLLLTVLLFTTGLTANNASAASYRFTNLATWATVGYGYTTSGGFVGALQSNLWASRFQTVTGPVDQVFGSGTRQGLINFQNQYGLGADGIAGSQTWRQMERFTFTVDSRNRTFRNTSATYAVKFNWGSTGTGTAYDYHLQNTSTGRIVTSGTMWEN